MRTARVGCRCCCAASSRERLTVASHTPSFTRRTRHTIALVALATLAILTSGALATRAQAQPVRGGYLYTLSSFTGPIRQNWSRVTVDRERNEVYALFQNTARVFNDSGMEVYRFGDDLDQGQIVDVSVDERGDIFLLTFRDSRFAIVQCNYRGDPQSVITLKRAPPEFADFSANRLIVHGKQFFLASTLGLKIVIADRDGTFVDGYDLFTLFELEEKDRGVVELGGFSVDRDGTILMTAPVLFRAYLLSPDGKLRTFGRPGGAPGRFNIPGGIARDRRGNVLVVDRLKGGVLVFNDKLQYVTQVSAYGRKPGELVFPEELAVDDRDRVYVTQAGKRGISVFKLTYQ